MEPTTELYDAAAVLRRPHAALVTTLDATFRTLLEEMCRMNQQTLDAVRQSEARLTASIEGRCSRIEAGLDDLEHNSDSVYLRCGEISAATSVFEGYIGSGSTPTTLTAADFIPSGDTTLYDIYGDNFLGADTPKTFGASSAATLDSSVNSSPAYDQNTLDDFDAKASTDGVVAAGVGNVGGSNHGLASTHAATTTVSASSVTSSDMPATCLMKCPIGADDVVADARVFNIPEELLYNSAHAAATPTSTLVVPYGVHTGTPTKCSILGLGVGNTSGDVSATPLAGTDTYKDVPAAEVQLLFFPSQLPSELDAASPVKCSMNFFGWDSMSYGASNIGAQMSTSARGIALIFCPAKRLCHAVVLWKQEMHSVDWQPWSHVRLLQNFHDCGKLRPLPWPSFTCHAADSVTWNASFVWKPPWQIHLLICWLSSCWSCIDDAACLLSKGLFKDIQRRVNYTEVASCKVLIDVNFKTPRLADYTFSHLLLSKGKVWLKLLVSSSFNAARTCVIASRWTIPSTTHKQPEVQIAPFFTEIIFSHLRLLFDLGSVLSGKLITPTLWLSPILVQVVQASVGLDEIMLWIKFSVGLNMILCTELLLELNSNTDFRACEGILCEFALLCHRVQVQGSPTNSFVDFLDFISEGNSIIVLCISEFGGICSTNEVHQPALISYPSLIVKWQVTAVFLPPQFNDEICDAHHILEDNDFGIVISLLSTKRTRKCYWTVHVIVLFCGHCHGHPSVAHKCPVAKKMQYSRIIYCGIIMCCTPAIMSWPFYTMGNSAWSAYFFCCSWKPP